MNTILIIEDEKILAHSLSYALKAVGYETVVATTGGEGLRLAQSTKPSLILLDLMSLSGNGRKSLAFRRRLQLETPMGIA